MDVAFSAVWCSCPFLASSGLCGKGQRPPQRSPDLLPRWRTCGHAAGSPLTARQENQPAHTNTTHQCRPKQAPPTPPRALTPSRPFPGTGTFFVPTQPSNHDCVQGRHQRRRSGECVPPLPPSLPPACLPVCMSVCVRRSSACFGNAACVAGGVGVSWRVGQERENGGGRHRSRGRVMIRSGAHDVVPSSRPSSLLFSSERPWVYCPPCLSPKPFPFSSPPNPCAPTHSTLPSLPPLPPSRSPTP
jgi:hypothetical protein